MLQYTQDGKSSFYGRGKKHIFFSFKNNYFKNLMFHIFKNIQRRILLLLFFLGELIDGFFVQEVVVGGVISFYKYFYQ